MAKRTQDENLARTKGRWSMLFAITIAWTIYTVADWLNGGIQGKDAVQIRAVWTFLAAMWIASVGLVLLTLIMFAALGLIELRQRRRRAAQRIFDQEVADKIAGILRTTGERVGKRGAIHEPTGDVRVVSVEDIPPVAPRRRPNAR
jgi:hypothetical protein